ncbi:unnamed protein product, partial [Brassica oleracea var. botrytis]
MFFTDTGSRLPPANSRLRSNVPRILIDGLSPITKDTIIDFAIGEEALITLEYEGLQNFCAHCLHLSHPSSDCPTRSRRSREAGLTSPSVASRDRTESQRLLRPTGQVRSPHRSGAENRHISQHNGEPYSQRLDRHGKPFGERISSTLVSAKPISNRASSQDTRPEGRRETPVVQSSPPYNTNKSPRRRAYDKASSFYEPARNEASEQQRYRDSRNQSSHSDTRNMTWVEKAPHPPLEHNLNVADFPPPPRIPTTEEVMEELREVTFRYTNVQDPTESAARRQRVLDSEVHGLMEKTAAGIISNAEAAAGLNQQLMSLQPSATTIPIFGHSVEVEQLPASLPTPLPPTVLPSQAQAPSVPLPKRRGRPPRTKTTEEDAKKTANQRLLTGSSSRKRILSMVQRSP